MNEQIKLDKSTSSNPIQNDISPQNIKNQECKDIYKEKNLIKNNNPNNYYINLNNEKNFETSNNIITETGKISLIKNPPNLLKLFDNEDDEYLKILNENIKLGSELTLEKSKVIKLNNLLKEKETENTDLKLKIEELEKNYQEIENDRNKFFENKINSIYKKISLDKNNLKGTYEAIQRCKDNELFDLNKKINNLYNIIDLFFEMFNDKLNLLKKTGILADANKINLEKSNKMNYKNSLYIINSLDELIKKLLKDNKNLYDELIQYKEFKEKYENSQTDKNEEEEENDEEDEDNNINNNENTQEENNMKYNNKFFTERINDSSKKYILKNKYKNYDINDSKNINKYYKKTISDNNE